MYTQFLTDFTHEVIVNIHISSKYVSMSFKINIEDQIYTPVPRVL